MTSLLVLATLFMPQSALKIAVFSPNVWRPDPPAARWRYRTEGQFESNGIIIRAPKQGEDVAKWRKAIETFRQDVRNGSPECVELRFDGQRSWVKLRFEVAKALAIRPGEQVTVTCQARCTEGSGQFGLAFEIRDMNGLWRAWSNGIPSHKTLKTGGRWQSVSFTASPPDFDPKTQYAVPIVGQDAVLSKEKGTIEVKDLTISAASSAARKKAAAGLKKPLDLSLYEKTELLTALNAYTSAFLFLYDATVYDPKTDKLDLLWFAADMYYKVGGADVVLLWQAYPRIGVDERNQFDFFRDMPGGLAGLKAQVDAFHKKRIRVMIPYNPWDTGTRREGVSDAAALAQIVKAIGADGVFLDTMNEPQAGLREELDRLNLGQSLEPEGVLPDYGELSVCDSSWAQWLPYYPEPGILVHKWIEPRHMQHQIRRWNTDHSREIEEAFFNASGMLVWENVFGTWNPWKREDARRWLSESLWLRKPLRRGFDLPNLLEGTQRWTPFVETGGQGIYASEWRGQFLVLNLTDKDYTGRIVKAGMAEFALNTLPPHELQVKDGWVVGTIGDTAVIGLANDKSDLDGLVAVMDRTYDPGIQLPKYPDHPPYVKINPGDHHPTPPSPTHRIPRSEPPPSMVFIPGGQVHMKITHQRRECGCYPDPGSKPEDEKKWTWGDPWWQELRHDYTETVGPYFIDEALVTNADFEKFLNESGYVPKVKENFLKHWGNVDGARLAIDSAGTGTGPGAGTGTSLPNPSHLRSRGKGPSRPVDSQVSAANRQPQTANQIWKCPPALRDLPVVYVDLDDARAYTKWAGKRLPTEAEWQLAAQGTDGRKWPWGSEFDLKMVNAGSKGPTPVRAYPKGGPFGIYDTTGNVYQWTESERLGGNTRYCILRGGSWFRAEGSGWYVQGGAHPLDHHTKFLLLGPALNRCSTIGFRCVADAK